MNLSIKAGVVAAIVVSMLAGCASYTGQTNDPNDPNRTKRGALIGAGVGAAVGLLAGTSAKNRREKAMLGAGIGALAGGGIGAYQDRQEAELRRQTAGTGVDVQRDGDVIKLNLPDGVTFDFNKTDVKPQFYPALNNIAHTISQYNQTIVEINGHTDNVGTVAVNQRISEQRAQSVANYLSSQGVQSVRMETHGYNFQYPIADNNTDAGRAANRRVEIRLVPLTNNGT
ncbi:MAG: OmpA family protein [Proteobacteria bacterium]|nr:OmpA family protein [Pseudomonadota bacterium]MBS0217275.1 OmpA family protein [Pseudomonadota bacterium]